MERLVAQARPREFYGFREQLLELCADILAHSEGRTVVFVGRSPENAYDLLRALLGGARGIPQLRLMPFSCRVGTLGTARRLSRTHEPQIDGLGRHLHDLGVGPAQIAQDHAGVMFVDCVCWGTTFGNLEELLQVLARRQGVDPRAVAGKVKYLGLTKQSLGWTHWRNDPDSAGDCLFQEGRAAVVPITHKLWCHLAGVPKTTRSYGPDSWTGPPALSELDKNCAEGVRLSAELFCFGCSRDVRRAFAGKLSRRQPRWPWLGSLIVEVLKLTQLRRGKRRS